jgi:hypothetical protein
MSVRNRATACIQVATEVQPAGLCTVFVAAVQMFMLCTVYALVLCTDLLDTKILSFVTQLVQAFSGTAILAHLLVLLCRTRCHWTDANERRRVQWVLRDLEVESSALDFALAPVETSQKTGGWLQQQQQREPSANKGTTFLAIAGEEGGRCAMPPGLTAFELALIASCAVLSILTAAPTALGTAIGAFVLYSAGARIAELLLAMQALRSCLTQRLMSTDQIERIVPAQPRIPPLNNAGDGPPLVAALDWRAPSQHTSPTPAPSAPVPAVSPPPSVTYWRKPWAWMLAARDGPIGHIVWSPPTRTVSHEHHEHHGEVRSLGLVSLGQNSSGSSSSGENSRRNSISSLGDDSTDSGGAYFV